MVKWWTAPANVLPGTVTAAPLPSPTLFGVPWQLEVLLTLAGEGATGEELEG